MKPCAQYCKKYCDLYDTCDRTECNRKPMWHDDGVIMMVEPIEYDKLNKAERLREWKSVPLTKVDLIVKYN